MTLSRAGEAFNAELHALLNRMKAEWNLSLAEAVGVLHIAATSLVHDVLNEDEEGDGG